MSEREIEHILLIFYFPFKSKMLEFCLGLLANVHLYYIAVELDEQ